jgi:hypothetical protein
LKNFEQDAPDCTRMPHRIMKKNWSSKIREFLNFPLKIEIGIDLNFFALLRN